MRYSANLCWFHCLLSIQRNTAAATWWGLSGNLEAKFPDELQGNQFIRGTFGLFASLTNLYTQLHPCIYTN